MRYFISSMKSTVFVFDIYYKKYELQVELRLMRIRNIIIITIIIIKIIIISWKRVETEPRDETLVGWSKTKQKQIWKFSGPVQFRLISLRGSKSFAQDCRSLSLLWKSQSYQFFPSLHGFNHWFTDVLSY